MHIKKQNLALFLFSLLAGWFLLSAQPVLAQFAQTPDLFNGQEAAIQSNIGLTGNTPQVIAARIINITLGFAGIIFLGLTVYAGYLWMTSGGDAAKIEKAKKMLMAAIIGLILVLSSWAIARYIVNRLNNAIGPGSQCTPGTTQPCGCGGTATCNASGGWDACVGSTCSTGGLGSDCDGNTLTPYVAGNPATCEPGGTCASGLFCDIFATVGAGCTCQPLGGLGASCNGTTTPGVCDPMQNMCDPALTCAPAGDPDECTCIGSPMIEWITPEDGSGNPVGTTTNFMTIGGRFFGTFEAGTSTVRFLGNVGNPADDVVASFPNTVNPACTDNWTDSQIIIVVPPGAQPGPIQVVRGDGKEDVTDNSRGPSIPDFLIDNTIRPGLCLSRNTTAASIECFGKSCGYQDDAFQLQGANFTGATRDIYIGNYNASTTANSPAWVSNLTANATVPNLKPSNTSVFVKVNGNNSNTLNFGVKVDTSKLPKIDYIDPAQGPRGQYITIYGSNFGNVAGKVTFTGGPAVQADINFPKGCDNYWHGDYIVVKVPNGAAIMQNQVTVTTAQAATSDPVDFNVTAGTPGPGICKLVPHNGDVDQAVEAIGERFGTYSGSAAARFHNGIDDPAIVAGDWTAGDVKAKVPAGAETGPFRIVDSGGTLSNSINFMVGKCTDVSQCETGEQCCAGGIKDGICSNNCEDPGAAATCMFSWGFNTGAATPPLTCAGYTNAAQCLAAASCPNSPGMCQTSSVGSVGSCGTNYCATKYPQCAGGVCTYDATKNLCVTATSCNEAADLSGAKSKVYTGESINDFSSSYTASVPIVGSSMEMDGSNTVYTYTGKNRWAYSTEYIPVDSTRTYLISARFRSLGAGPSITYLGFMPFDANKRFIESLEVIRYGSDETITAFDNTSITVAEPISGWNNGSIAGNRSLAFYYNGDTTKLPDATRYWYPAPFIPNSYSNPAPTQGTFSTAVGNTINLNTPLPAAITSNIILGTTRVKNHSAGGTYLYTGAAGVPINDNGAWHEAGGNIIGEDFMNSPNKFRPTTKFVKFIFGINYDNTVGQVGPAATKVWVDDLIFAPTLCSEVKGKSVFQIDVGGASCPQGSFRDSNNLCTMGTISNPKLCTLCPSGFSCSSNVCAVNTQICPQGSTCDLTAGSPTENTCVDSSATCECCCRVANSAQDCCPGLTCEAGGCGSGAPTYGLCTGCRVELAAGTTTAQETQLSNDACNCRGGSNRICDFDDTDPTDTGTCQDAGGIGAACDDESPDTPACVLPNDANCMTGLVCDTTSCTCQATTTPTGTPCDGDTTNATCDPDSSLCDATNNEICDNSTCTCVPNAPAGTRCIPGGLPLCTVGVPACGADYACLNDSGADCRCCCDPGDGTPGDPPDINVAGLRCEPNITPCVGGQRGLYCGCKDDIQCGSPTIDGCGTDTCCRPKPRVSTTTPAENAVNVCRNPLIEVAFNQPMDINSFSSNVVVVGDYKTTSCPANTTYLTKSSSEPTGTLARLWNRVKIWFGGEANAIGGNFCSITGTVTGYNDAGTGNGVLQFSPTQVLDPLTDYYVVVKGDASSTDGARKGVLNSYGITMDTSGPTWTASSTGGYSENFNTVMYYGKVWRFTTKPNLPTDNGICKFDKVELVPPSYTFSKAAATTSIVAYPESSDGSRIVPLPAIYNWTWSWLSEDPTVVTVTNTNNTIQTLTAGNKKDARTYADAQARITTDSVNVPTTINQTRNAKALIRLFLCANPWPPMNNLVSWPWQDASNNCNVAGTGACDTYNFEFYYCRDGAKGNEPALPSIENSTTTIPIRGSYDEILKEYFFLRAVNPNATGLIATPTVDGGKVSLTWGNIGGVDGYKIYYGTQSGQYKDYFDVGNTTSALIPNLTNGTKYYFAIKSYVNASGAESAYSTEVAATPKDLTPPAMPANLAIISNIGTSATIGWDKNTDDTVKYRLYLGTTPMTTGVDPAAGQVLDTGAANQAVLSGLNAGVTYYVTVTALDPSGNESTKAGNVLQIN